MNDTSSGWRDKQGLSRPERLKEERVRRLRDRFARITELYEFAMARRKLAGGTVWPLLVGAAGGVAIYFLFFR